MPKSRKSSRKNGKPADKPDNQWVHVEDTPQPDSWEIVEDANPQDDPGKLSDDDLIVILEDSCQQSLDLSLVTEKIPQELPKDSPKQESPSTEESPVTSQEESPESELDKSSDFQIIDHSEEESSIETDLLLENEILEAAKRNVSLKYSHIVRQSAPSTSQPSAEILSTGVPEVPIAAESLMPEEVQPVSEDAFTDEKQMSKPKTHREDPEDSSVSGKDPVVESPTPEDAMQSAVTGTAKEQPQETAEVDAWTGFVEKKSKRQKKKGKKRLAAVEATEDVMDQTAASDPKDPQITQESEQDTTLVQKEYFETYSKNKQQRDLATMSILLAKDQTIEDLHDEEPIADTPDLQEQEPIANIEEPKRSLEVVRESSVSEETESVSGGSEGSASVAGTEESSDKLDADKDNDDQNVPKRVSKSARRRKKLKEKMAKVIENFSNPGLVMEKYEKTFGEDYIPLRKVLESEIDDSMTCPVCFELYYHPYHVKPCGHIFCEPCLRKLTTRSCLDVPCPLCREIIQSCHVDEELSNRITKSFPVKSAARNRTERRHKTKRNPLPRMDMEAGKPVSIKDIHARGGKGQGYDVQFSRITIQRFLLVLIGLISYMFTSFTVRAIAYFDFNGNNSTSYIFMTLIFCLYFYFVDKGVQKLKFLVES